MVDGVYYLHTRSPPIIHGDLHDVSTALADFIFLCSYIYRKLNILVTCTGECLLCDFGLSRIRHEISRTDTTVHHGGRERFLAPEITHNAQENTRIDEPSDIYSLAMTVYALGTRSLPFADLKNIHAVCREAASGRRPSKHDSLGGLTTDDTELLWSLLERMWDGRPEFRPTIFHVRDEIMKSNLIYLESATVPMPIAASSGNGQPSTSTAFLQHPDRLSSQVLAPGNKDQRINGPTLPEPFVPKVDESSDFDLINHKNGIESLKTKIHRLEREIQLAKNLDVNPAGLRMYLLRRISNMLPQNAPLSRPLPPVLPIFPLAGNMTVPVERSIQPGYLIGGYGLVVNRAAIEAAVLTWDPQTNPSSALTLLLYVTLWTLSTQKADSID